MQPGLLFTSGIKDADFCTEWSEPPVGVVATGSTGIKYCYVLIERPVPFEIEVMPCAVAGVARLASDDCAYQ